MKGSRKGKTAKVHKISPLAAPQNDAGECGIVREMTGVGLFGHNCGPYSVFYGVFPEILFDIGFRD